MERTAIVTGGTGGLGAAVVERLLDDGWRVVVPWIVEHELERVEQRDGLELVQADLFDPDAVARGGCRPRRRRRRAAARPRQPGRRLRRRRPRPRDPDRGVRAAVPAQPAPDLPDDPGRAPAACSTAGGGSIVCVGTRAALQPFTGAAGYIASKAAVIAFVAGGGGRIQGRRHPLQRDPAERDRHARQPRRDAQRRPRRWVKPQQIAGVIAFLLSDDSAPISGAAIPVYGRA